MEQSVKEILVDDFWIMPATPEYIDEGVPYITSKNIKNGIIDFTKVNYISQDAYENISKNRPILVGDILISMIGTLGETAEVKETDGSFYGQNMFLVRLDENKVNKRYFLNFFKSNSVKRALGGKQNQSTQKYLKANHIEDLIIPVPSLGEQIFIAEQLDKLSRIIALRSKELKHLDDLIKARFVELFGDPSKNEKNWNIVDLESLTSIVTYGLTVRPKYIDEGIDLVSARELHKGFIEYSAAPKISEVDFQSLSEKGKPQKNDILFSKTGSIGHCALVEDDRLFAITQNAARIGLKQSVVNPLWLLYYLRMDYIQDWCKSHAKGNAVKDFQLQDMKVIPIFDCPVNLQQQFADFVRQVDKSKVVIQESLNKTQQLFDSLMQEYFG